MRVETTKNMLFWLLLFLSGMSALIYQTLWVKQLGLIVGVDVYSVTIAVSAFFTGLALGGFFFGRIADAYTKPYLLISKIELGIAILGIVSTLLLAKIPELFVSVQDIAGPLAWLIPFLIIGVPAFLMGGTLPVFVKCSGPNALKIGKVSGSFYAANTFGAIIGTLLVPFFLIPSFGILGVSIVAAFLNLSVAGIAYLANRSFEAKPVNSERTLKLKSGAKLALVLYSLAGGLAIGYEVVWSQAIAPLLSSRVYAFAIMLATYLLGLVIGSSIYARYADKTRHPWIIFGLLIMGAGISAILIFSGSNMWMITSQDSVGRFVFKLTEGDMVSNFFRFLFTSGTILLIPTIFLGAAFPAATRIIAGPDKIGRDIGLVTALNTLGGILGTLITGFLLIPIFGLIKTLSLLALASILVGGIALYQEKKSKRFSIVFVPVIFLVVLFVSWNIPRDKLAQLLVEKRGGETVFYEESAGGTVAVLKQRAPSNTFNRLYIQGVSNSGNSFTSLRYMRLQALLPLIIHKETPKSTMVIGFGTGITLGSMLFYPELEQIICAELLPGVLKAASHFPENKNVLDDPRVTVKVRDGRHELLSSDQKFDLITLEPPPPAAAGVVNLYSKEFYEIASKRLNKNGMVAQWWPIATQNSEDSKSLVKSFLEVFPHVTLWTTELHEMLLVGSMDPIVLNVEKVETLFEDSVLKESLEEVGILNAKEFFATYVTDKKGLSEYVGLAEPVTDNRPSIEYSGWVRKGEFTRVLTELAAIQTPPNFENADTDTVREIAIHREKLWVLYRAGYYSYLGDQENWEAMLKRIIPELKRNPYFAWFVGDAN